MYEVCSSHARTHGRAGHFLVILNNNAKKKFVKITGRINFSLVKLSMSSSVVAVKWDWLTFVENLTTIFEFEFFLHLENQNRPCRP